MDIKAFILLPREWRWGGLPVETNIAGEDCTTFAASWVLEATGRDPAASLRGTYSTAEGAEDILRAYGGAEGLVEDKLSRLGFARTSEPVDGDVGIVRATVGMDGSVVKEIPAIRFGPLWAVMAARGPQVKKLDWTGAAWNIVV